MKRVLRNKDTGNFLVRYIKSFFHAIDGIRYAVIHEHNMIIIVSAIIVVTLAGIHYNISDYEWLFCIVLFGMVAGCEMINTAIEAVVDLETTKEHPLAKIAKDTAAGATLVFCFASFIGALVIFIPKLFGC